MDPEDRPNIVLYFPYHGVGGVSVLFLRLGGLLADEANIYFVDFADGWMARQLPPNTHLIPFGSDNTYPENAVFVFQTVAPWNLVDHAKFPANSRVMFWNLFPYNLNPSLFLGATGTWIRRACARMVNLLSGPRRRKLGALLEYLENRRSIVFMDGENLSTTEKLFRRRFSAPRVLPVLTDVPGNPRWQPPSGKRDELWAAWVGRVEDFKVPILCHLITRLEALGPEGRTKLILIGGGDGLQSVKDLAAGCRYLSVDFRGELPPNELSTVLTSEVDLLFAMGTSALDGAKRGVPTVLLDYSYSPITGLYRFSYIFSVREHNLGCEIRPCHLEERSTLGELIAVLRRRPDLISDLCFVHWDLYHNPARWLPSVRGTLAEAKATVGELRELGFFSPDLASRTIKAARNRLLPKTAVAGIRTS